MFFRKLSYRLQAQRRKNAEENVTLAKMNLIQLQIFKNTQFMLNMRVYLILQV